LLGSLILGDEGGIVGDVVLVELAGLHDHADVLAFLMEVSVPVHEFLQGVDWLDI